MPHVLVPPLWPLASCLCVWSIVFCRDVRPCSGPAWGEGLASQPRRYRMPVQPLLNQHQVGVACRGPVGLTAQSTHRPQIHSSAAKGTSRHRVRSGQQKVAPRRSTRREERVTVQGPVKTHHTDEMSHRGC